jgi:hypothetical protein
MEARKTEQEMIQVLIESGIEVKPVMKAFIPSGGTIIERCVSEEMDIEKAYQFIAHRRSIARQIDPFE